MKLKIAEISLKRSQKGTITEFWCMFESYKKGSFTTMNEGISFNM